MNLRMDLSKKDLHMFFRDWQVKVLNYLWENKEGFSVKELYASLGEDTISRASILYFLNEAVDNGLVEKEITTGRGGIRGIYSSKYDLEGTKQYLVKEFTERLQEL